MYKTVKITLTYWTHIQNKTCRRLFSSGCLTLWNELYNRLLNRDTKQNTNCTTYQYKSGEGSPHFNVEGGAHTMPGFTSLSRSGQVRRKSDRAEGPLDFEQRCQQPLRGKQQTTLTYIVSIISIPWKLGNHGRLTNISELCWHSRYICNSN